MLMVGAFVDEVQLMLAGVGAGARHFLLIEKMELLLQLRFDD